jgi:hypothetical protein
MGNLTEGKFIQHDNYQAGDDPPRQCWDGACGGEFHWNNLKVLSWWTSRSIFESVLRRL